MSPLFLFGRQQDFAYQQEVDGNPAQRHHVRFWRCPDGLAAAGRRAASTGSRPAPSTRAVGLSLFTLQVTHKIDADTDVERDHIVRDRHRGRSAGRGRRHRGLLDRLSRAQRRRRLDHDRRRPADRRRARREGGDAVTTPRPDKRPAFEPAARASAARPATTPTCRGRPSTVAGVVLVLLRVLAGVVVLAAISAGLAKTARERRRLDRRRVEARRRSRRRRCWIVVVVSASSCVAGRRLRLPHPDRATTGRASSVMPISAISITCVVHRVVGRRTRRSRSRHVS